MSREEGQRTKRVRIDRATEVEVRKVARRRRTRKVAQRIHGKELEVKR